jgi:hypothetical protein
MAPVAGGVPTAQPAGRGVLDDRLGEFLFGISWTPT